MTLEQKLSRLKQIQEQLTSGSVPLSQSMTLLEEATTLKKEIEKELKIIENKLVELEQANETAA